MGVHAGAHKHTCTRVHRTAGMHSIRAKSVGTHEAHKLSAAYRHTGIATRGSPHAVPSPVLSFFAFAQRGFMIPSPSGPAYGGLLLALNYYYYKGTRPSMTLPLFFLFLFAIAHWTERRKKECLERGRQRLRRIRHPLRQPEFSRPQRKDVLYRKHILFAMH